MATKTWAQKMVGRLHPEVKILERPFAGYPPGTKMLIATPTIVQSYVEAIPKGQTRTILQMREDLARRHDADMTCPLTAGIFARIVAEDALDRERMGETNITPFWRLIDPKAPLGRKLSCGQERLADLRAGERDPE